MNKHTIYKKINDFIFFIWLIILILISTTTTYFYNINKKSQIEFLNKSLKNIYLHKFIKNITSELKPRYINTIHVVKQGDTYESIINNLKISEKEKKLFLKTVAKKKKLKVLKLNQKISFKIDRRGNEKILEFKIEIDNKNEIFFSRSQNNKIFNSTTIEKNLDKTITYKETIITSSLYNSAIELGIKANIIIDFARLYGFQVDFQRDVWKNDSFQIIYEEFKNEKGTTVDTGDIIYANLNLQNNDLNLYKFEYEKGKIDYFDENGKSVRKTLMKTPINGAKLSSSLENLPPVISLRQCRKTSFIQLVS